MTEPAIQTDTHEQIKVLVQSGIPEAQAEAILTIFKTNPTLATKTDIAEARDESNQKFAETNERIIRLEIELTLLKERVTKIDERIAKIDLEIAQLRSDMQQQKIDLIKWIVGTVFLATVLLIATRYLQT